MAQTSGPVVQLNQLISGIETAMLTTVRPDGSLHSCPMASRAADDNGVLWFISHNQTEKVEAVRTSQRANLAYVDPVAGRYVSVSGFCELVRDQARAKLLWDPSYASWFSGGVEDPSLVLLKVDIQQAEYWDASLGRMVPIVGFRGVV